MFTRQQYGNLSWSLHELLSSCVEASRSQGSYLGKAGEAEAGQARERPHVSVYREVQEGHVSSIVLVRVSEDQTFTKSNTIYEGVHAMAIQKLSRSERNAQTKARNERRKELFASIAYKSGKLSRCQIRKNSH